MTDLGYTYDACAWLTHYGRFTGSAPRGVVIHSLECDAIDHIAEQLSAPGGWLDGEGLAPQRMTDPVSIVKSVPDGYQGGHIGGPGNSLYVGVEVSGRAAWTPAQWATPKARAGLDHQARAVAGLYVVYGHGYDEIRWLSIAQLRAGYPFGMCTHNDISISGVSNTNHWDPGTGFDFAWFLSRVQYWFLVMTGGGTPPPAVGTDWWDTVDEAAATRAMENAVSNVLGRGGRIDGLFYSDVIKQIWQDTHGSVAAAQALEGRIFDRQPGSQSVTDEVLYATNLLAGKLDDAANAARAVGLLGLVVDDTGGGWYAIGPGQFYHLPNFDQVNAAKASGLLADVEVHTDAAGIALLRAVAMGGPDTISPPPPPVTHTVVAGDTLGSIAQTNAVTIAQLIGWNSLPNPDSIDVGQVLQLGPTA